MHVIGQVRKGAYFDSVTLMRVGKEITGMKNVVDAALVMGTKANKSILQNSGLLLGEFDRTGDTDLLVAVKARDKAAAEHAVGAVEEELKKATKKSSAAGEAPRPATLEGAVEAMPDANLVLISVAGRYAGAEAMKALESGLHVMLFSDNVPIETELMLKQYAAKRGLLVMGPDCGTAIINGVPLAFANVVNRGSIGIVAAAGTGLQEVSTIISNEGEGVSQAIGTGGRDVKKDIGGIMFIEGIKALGKDPATEVILLVSKPPHDSVVDRINQVLKGIRKPVVPLFLGAEAGPGRPRTLEEAALLAVELARGGKAETVAVRLSSRREEIQALAAKLAARRKKGQRYVRGLFSGGTFCAEAQILFSPILRDLYSNAPAGRALQLKDSMKSVKNTILDLGEDEFTVGRPHPMIDLSLRNRRILDEAGDPETAVILLDVVLGYGSHLDPVSELAPVVKKACRKVCVVCSVTGTDRDPQNRGKVAAALRKAGAEVLPTNAAACELAGAIIQKLGRK